MSFRHLLRRHHTSALTYLRARPSARAAMIASAVLVLLMIVLPLWRLLPIVRENPFIPLHYNVYLGIDRFGPWYEIFILPALGLVFLVFNLLLAARFSAEGESAFGTARREPVLSAFLLWLTPALELLFAAGVVFTLLINL